VVAPAPPLGFWRWLLTAASALATVAAIGIASDASQWRPLWLVALLFAMSLATELSLPRVAHGTRPLEISGSAMAAFCAMVLLGPAVAACIAAATVAIESSKRRKAVQIVIWNSLGFGAYTLIGGFLVASVVDPRESTVPMALAAIGLYVACEALSWAFAILGRYVMMLRPHSFPAYVDQLLTAMPSAIAGGVMTATALWTFHAGGGVALAMLGVGLLLLQGLYARLNDVEFALRAERDRAQTYLDSAGSLFVILDAENRIAQANRRAQQVIGLTEHELVGTRWEHLLRERASFIVALETAAHRSARVEADLRVASGQDRVILWSIEELSSVHGERQLLLSGEDITDRRVAERRLEHLAFHDPLTELPNRAAFARSLSRSLGRSEGCAVLFIDLDGFKRVNDALGHGAGDELLCHAGQRLLGCVRSNDVVARQSGDEFLVLLDALPVAADEAEAVVDEIVERMVASLEQPYGLQAGEARVAASIGVALHPRDGDEPEELIARADHRMYAQKAVSAS
jgi:diguanylate cyclase (GGDEF)-like protein/PAS domain S-box-containing protein